VDDSAAIRQFVAGNFQAAGFRVCGEATNGRHAIELVRQFQPDLIILDLSMPEMDGLQAAPELKKVAPNTAIILFTLYGGELESTPVSKLSVDLVLSKKTPFAELIESARRLVGIHVPPRNTKTVSGSSESERKPAP
jgi:DNA-binding NarL/FixJ family response regulator